MLTVDEARQLDALSVGELFATTGTRFPGRHQVRTRGAGLDFDDFRRYQPGDDPRFIDWTIYSRLQQLMVRISPADARQQVHLIVDTSRSMAAGTPDKLSCATRVAAMLAYVALNGRDAVGIATFDSRVTLSVAPAAGRAQLHRVFAVLQQTSARGASDHDAALMDFGALSRGPGLAVVISDFFHARGCLDGLRFLRHRGLTPAVVQVLSPDELRPLVDDEVELTDLEDNGAAPLIVDRRVVAAYQERMAALWAELTLFSREQGMPAVRVESSFDVRRLVRQFASAGLLSGAGAP